MNSLEVRDSTIHGKGVFALRNFTKGEKVLVWNTSHRVENIADLSEEEKHFITPYKGGFVLLYPPERYVNHSCSANVHSSGGADIAIRDIRKGEEITANYFAEKIIGHEFECTCGSQSCKKRITSTS